MIPVPNGSVDACCSFRAFFYEQPYIFDLICFVLAGTAAGGGDSSALVECAAGLSEQRLQSLLFVRSNEAWGAATHRIAALFRLNPEPAAGAPPSGQAAPSAAPGALPAAEAAEVHSTGTSGGAGSASGSGSASTGSAGGSNAVDSNFEDAWRPYPALDTTISSIRIESADKLWEFYEPPGTKEAKEAAAAREADKVARLVCYSSYSHQV